MVSFKNKKLMFYHFLGRMTSALVMGSSSPRRESAGEGSGPMTTSMGRGLFITLILLSSKVSKMRLILIRGSD